MHARASWLLLISVLLVVGLFASLAIADTAPDPQALITSQLDAFARNDAAAAFAVAAPGIQQRFTDPDTFLKMVETTYPPVFHHKSVQFGKQTREGDQIGQTVIFIDGENEVWGGLYTLELETDGSWKISGCVLIKSDQSSL